MDAELSPLVLLAGGRSSRAGEPKGLVAIDDRPWIEGQIAAFARAGGARVIVVLGHAHDVYTSALPWMAAPATIDGVAVEVAINAAPERGPFSSLQEGARRVAGGAFVLPIDVPCPSPEVWRALEDTRSTAVPVYGGRGGHPVRLSATAIRDCLAMDPTTSRLDVFLRARSDVARLDVDDRAVVANLNTPEDWRAWTRR